MFPINGCLLSGPMENKVKRLQDPRRRRESWTSGSEITAKRALCQDHTGLWANLQDPLPAWQRRRAASDQVALRELCSSLFQPLLPGPGPSRSQLPSPPLIWALHLSPSPSLALGELKYIRRGQGGGASRCSSGSDFKTEPRAAFLQ